MGLLHEVAQVPSYKAAHLFAVNSAFGTKRVLPNFWRMCINSRIKTPYVSIQLAGEANGLMHPDTKTTET